MYSFFKKAIHAFFVRGIEVFVDQYESFINILKLKNFYRIFSTIVKKMFSTEIRSTRDYRYLNYVFDMILTKNCFLCFIFCEKIKVFNYINFLKFNERTFLPSKIFYHEMR